MPAQDDDRKKFERDIHFHLQESEEKQKDWFAQVYKSIENLHDKIDRSSLKSREDKEELLKLLMEHREKLLVLVQEAQTISKADLEKLERNLDKVIASIKSSLNKLTFENSDLKRDIESESNKLKNIFRDTLEERFEKHLESDAKLFGNIEEKFGKVDLALHKIGLTQNTLKTKIATYAVIVSLITTSIITVITGSLLFFFKEAIKALLGV